MSSGQTSGPSSTLRCGHQVSHQVVIRYPQVPSGGPQHQVPSSVLRSDVGSIRYAQVRSSGKSSSSHQVSSGRRRRLYVSSTIKYCQVGQLGLSGRIKYYQVMHLIIILSGESLGCTWWLFFLSSDIRWILCMHQVLSSGIRWGDLEYFLFRCRQHQVTTW